MTKTLVAVLLSAFAVASFAQAAAPADSASAPARKHHSHHHHKAAKAAPATNPMASDAKAGGK